jgi:hydrogenase expression/formation protein HypE
MDRRNQGKIPHDLLSRLLSKLTKPTEEVIVGPSVGEDAFAAGVGRSVIVASTDPITFASRHVGYYAVNVNANDVATMGARPRWFLATVLLPPRLKRERLRGLFDEIDRTCVDLGIRLCGGHTEITNAVTRPVIIGTMIGTVARRDLVLPRKAKRGDVVLMTKRLALEGTSIIAGERRGAVERVLGRKGAARARDFLFRPGISIVNEALAAVASASIHAMHDPTEGGLIWALKEISCVTGTGVEVDADKVPVYEETRLICERFNLNPFGLIGSGSLLIVVARTNALRVKRAVENLGIECTEIGRLKGRKPTLLKRGKRHGLPPLKADEITKVI